MATLSRWITRLFFDCKMSVTIGSRTILLENRGILVHTLRISSEDAQPHRQGKNEALRLQDKIRPSGAEPDVASALR
jgi:hypothetical protein